MPHTTKPQHPSYFRTALKSEGLEPQQTVSGDPDSLWTMVAWHPTQDEQLSVSEMRNGTFVVTHNQLVREPRGVEPPLRLHALSSSSTRSLSEALEHATTLARIFRHGRAQAMKLAPPSGGKLPLPNPPRRRTPTGMSALLRGMARVNAAVRALR